MTPLADSYDRETLAEVLQSWERETPVSAEMRRRVATELDGVGLMATLSGGRSERSRGPVARDGRARQTPDVIGRLEKTVIDCPDPHALARFYCEVLGMRVDEELDGWVVIGTEPGMREVAFQQVAEWRPPRWPDPAHPQQMHLDIRVSDPDEAERADCGLPLIQV